MSAKRKRDRVGGEVGRETREIEYEGMRKWERKCTIELHDIPASVEPNNTNKKSKCTLFHPSNIVFYKTQYYTGIYIQLQQTPWQQRKYILFQLYFGLTVNIAALCKITKARNLKSNKYSYLINTVSKPWDIFV